MTNSIITSTADFSDEEFDTVGGLVIQAFGHMPARHETTTVDDFEFEVVKADQRKIYSLRMRHRQPDARSFHAL